MSQVNLPNIDKPFQVGEWIADPDSGRLTRDDEEVRLEPKVMSVLVCLAQNPGKVVSRESLESTVWAGTIVGYDAIAGSVIKLRKALGDDSRNPKYVETVSKKGYRLVAKVSLDVGNVDTTESGESAVDVDSPEFRTPEFVRTRDKNVTTQLIAAIVGRLRTILEGRAYRYVMRMLGLLLAAFGAFLLWDALQRLELIPV